LTSAFVTSGAVAIADDSEIVGNDVTHTCVEDVEVCEDDVKSCCAENSITYGEDIGADNVEIGNVGSEEKLNYVDTVEDVDAVDAYTEQCVGRCRRFVTAIGWCVFGCTPTCRVDIPVPHCPYVPYQ